MTMPNHMHSIVIRLGANLVFALVTPANPIRAITKDRPYGDVDTKEAIMKDLVNLTHLFTPTRIKSMELKNRIAMAPIGTLMAMEDGNPSDRQAAYYEARARGGAGLTMEGVLGRSN